MDQNQIDLKTNEPKTKQTKNNTCVRERPPYSPIATKFGILPWGKYERYSLLLTTNLKDNPLGFQKLYSKFGFTTG